MVRRKTSSLVVVGSVALAAMAGSAMGQDSVSRNLNGGNGLPGDALSPWSTSQTKATYVVDMTNIRSSWGTTFGVAPVLKSGLNNPTRFTARNGPSSVSQSAKTGAAYPASSYTLWTAAGGGVNNPQNDLALTSSLATSGTATVFGVAFLDFDEVFTTTTSYFTNQAVSGLIAFDPDVPSRLFVSRTTMANNSTASNLADRSQFGLGAIDADGNLVMRADGVGVASTTNPLDGDNYFRIRTNLRSTAINLIDNVGATEASSWLLLRNTMTHNTPNAIPQDLAGRSVLVGADFVGNLRSETGAGSITSLTTHRPGTTDHRGGVAISAANPFAGSIATGGMLTRSTGGGGKVDSISVFGLNTNGGVTAARTLTLPASVLDACDAFSWPIAGGDFQHFDSQMTFRGGCGPVAVGEDQTGKALAAAVLYNGTSGLATNPYNAIAAARFDASNGASVPQWTVVAWVNSSLLTGKTILGDNGADGVAGTGDAGENDGVIDALDGSVGRLASMNETSLGFTGPSMSGPAFDSAGNVWFIASALVKRQVGVSIVQQPTLGLFRAVIDPATFCYKLELVMSVGDVIAGQNSGRNYRLDSLNVADTNSVSSATLWSNSVTQRGWNNVDVSALNPQDARTLGGLVISARIVYDVNSDTQFQDPTNALFTTSVDEAYNVVLYVGNANLPPACPCIADFDGSGGTPDAGDIDAFFVAWLAGDPSADADCSGGTPDAGDIDVFFVQWLNGGC